MDWTIPKTKALRRQRAVLRSKLRLATSTLNAAVVAVRKRAHEALRADDPAASAGLCELLMTAGDTSSECLLLYCHALLACGEVAKAKEVMAHWRACVTNTPVPLSEGAKEVVRHQSALFEAAAERSQKKDDWLKRLPLLQKRQRESPVKEP